jgi:hypothetical protein
MNRKIKSRLKIDGITINGVRLVCATNKDLVSLELYKRWE